MKLLRPEDFNDFVTIYTHNPEETIYYFIIFILNIHYLITFLGDYLHR